MNNLFDIATTDSHDHDHDDDLYSENIGRAIGITILAGCASFIGAFVIFCVKKEYIGVMPSALAFSAGVTIHLTFMSLIPECVELLHHSTQQSEALAEFYALLCVLAGILLIVMLEAFFHKFVFINVDHTVHTRTHAHPSVASSKTLTQSAVSAAARTDLDDHDNTAISDIDEQEKSQLQPVSYASMDVEASQSDNIKHNYSRVTYSVAIALILHHFPEGIATFVSLVYDFEFGILVAFALALHDIPSGICIAVPCYLATGSFKKPFLLCLIAAIAYPIGAFVGWAIIETTDEEFTDGFIGVLFGVVGGIMLYISFVELLPTAIIAANKFSNNDNYNKGKGYNVKTLCIILLFIGLLIMAISNILLKYVGGHNH